MKLNLESVLSRPADWERAGVRLPKFDVKAVRERTLAAPEWVHFGRPVPVKAVLGLLNLAMAIEAATISESGRRSLFANFPVLS